MQNEGRQQPTGFNTASIRYELNEAQSDASHLLAVLQRAHDLLGTSESRLLLEQAHALALRVSEMRAKVQAGAS